MQLRWGTYAFDANSLAVAFSSELALNEGGQPIKVRKRMDCDGYLNATGQAAIAQAASALVTALAKPYQDLILYRDDGTASDTKLTNADSISGVICQPPRFPDSRGGEYATFRHFQFSAEADYPVTNSQNLLLSYTERLSFSGGGPIYRHRMSLDGPPQKQLVYPFSIFKATQDGEAVGYRKRPIPPGPLWPSALMESPDFEKVAPKRRGRGYEEFRVTWRYRFESAVPLVGEPNVWRG